MKIVIFGLTLSSSWGNGHATPYRALLRALRRQGHSVTFYEKDVPYYAKHRDFESCEFCDLVLYADWNEIRRRALNDARDADAVINASYCPEGARIVDEVANVAPALHVFYDLDTPITLSMLAKSSVEYLRSDQIPWFDLHLSFTGGEILDQLERDSGARCARPLYGCVDPQVYCRVSEQREFSCLLSYMGTYAEDRQDKMDELFLEPARHLPNDKFVLAGSLYPCDQEWPENVQRHDHVSPAQHPGLYSSSQFTLNITRGDMARGGYCPSGRFFEAAACGTPIISDWFEGLDQFFEPGEEIFVVNDAKGMLSALQAPERQRTTMALRARERTLAEHSGDRRAEELMRYLEEARERKLAGRPRRPLGLGAAS